MSGTVCLQGGGEFGPGCRGMDAELVRRAAGPVAVTALAAEPGADYRTGTDHGVQHFRGLGATAVAVPDVRDDPAGALRALDGVRLLVLPGGSPSRLLAALRDSPVGQRAADLVADGGVVMGASAGAMVLCGWTVLPDRSGPHGMAVVPGLGVVDGVLVVPHWSGGGSRGDWLRAIGAEVPEDTVVLGLPEQSGVLVHGGALTAVGQSPTRLVGQERDLPPGTTWRTP